MQTSTTAKQAIITQIVALMEDTGTELVDLLVEVFSIWEDEDVLALFPEKMLQAALAYLEQEQAVRPDDEAGDADIDLS